MPPLDISNLSVELETHGGRFRAADGVSLSVDAREIVAIVGESGSGKSVAMLAVMGDGLRDALDPKLKRG
jgi:dipeptide transport system ATP-binding protein